MITKIEEERDKLAAKFEEKWKQLKELEKTTSLQISNLEKERAVLEEKLANLETKY
jgi:hypothetical protein